MTQFEIGMVRVWARRRATCAGLAAAVLALPMAAAATPSPALELSMLTEGCRDALVADRKSVVAEASACRLEMEMAWGPDDARLLPLYDALARRVAGAPKLAVAALPMRRRAEALAVQLYGAESLAAGETALAYVQNLILAGRCEGLDPAVGALLGRARAAFRVMEDPAQRSERMKAVAVAYSDALFFEDATETMLEAEDAMTAFDWENLASWRHRVGDLEGSEAALRTGLELALGATQRGRILHKLKAQLFTRGDFEALSELPEK